VIANSSPAGIGQSVIDSATEYFRRGWKVIPIPRGGKRPGISGWYDHFAAKTEKDLPELFGNGESVGILLGEASNGLTDVDIDAVEALVFADSYLLGTDLIHGRKSKPRSHRWFVCPQAKGATQFRDVNGAMLIEIRGGRFGTGGSFQTVVPPSIHPSGEKIEWAADGEPARVDVAELRYCVSIIAAGALLARHWPEKGSRHSARLALAGMLLRAGWSQNDVIKFMYCVNQAAKCDARLLEVTDTVQDSGRKLANKQPATGGPELAKLIGGEVVLRVREWLSLSRPEQAEHIPNLIVYDLRDFLVEAFPEAEALVKLSTTGTPVFKSSSLNQIFAWRGTGKTMLSLALARALAKGERFLQWQATRKVKVLYVEGEMPNYQLQERASALIGQTDPGFFRMLTFASQADGLVPLSTEQGRKALELVLGETEVLFLDSVSTLGWFPTNDEENWLEFLRWLNRLRQRGLCVIFLHHAGKSGMSRGHSRSEDMLDISIKLTRDEADKEKDWLRFTMEYDKFRYNPKGIRSLIVEYKESQWREIPVEKEKLKTLEEYLCLHPGASSRKIALDLPELGSHTTIQKLIRKLQEKKTGAGE
jgi:hypothetical protein